MLLSLIWLLSFLLSLPFTISYDVYSFNYRTFIVDCISHKNWIVKMFPFIEKSNFMQITRIFRLFTQCVIPIIIITYFYVRIMYHLIFGRSVVQSTSDNFQRQVSKTVKMLIAVVIVFAVSQISFYLSNNVIIELFIHSDNDDFENCTVRSKFPIICYIIFITGAVFNPFIYWWLSKSFRNDIKSLIMTCKLVRKWTLRLYCKSLFDS